MNEIQKQRVWRTFSEANHNGYFVWDVIEVMGEVSPHKYFTTCSDGFYIMIQCYHFWTKEQAQEFMNRCAMDEWQTIITI